ncbi:MAG: hypothetical protein RTU92_08395 [Candidatus Thorarchaeota archaeon]
MRKRILTTLFLVGFLLLPSVMAASNQGLSWGISVDQEVRYSFDTHTEISMPLLITTIDESYNIIVVFDSVPEIPPDITLLSNLPLPNVTLKFENGTEFNNIGGMTVEGLFALPVGNWSLWTDLVDDIHGSLPSSAFTWISDPTYWGYNISMDLIYPVHMSFKISRSDGILYYQYFSADMGVLGDVEYTMQRLGGGLVLDTTTMLLIGGGGVGLLVLVIVAWKLKRQ